MDGYESIYGNIAVVKFGEMYYIPELNLYVTKHLSFKSKMDNSIFIYYYLGLFKNNACFQE